GPWRRGLQSTVPRAAPTVLAQGSRPSWAVMIPRRNAFRIYPAVREMEMPNPRAACCQTVPLDRVIFRIVPGIVRSWGLEVGVRRKSVYNHLIQPIGNLRCREDAYEPARHPGGPAADFPERRRNSLSHRRTRLC